VLKKTTRNISVNINKIQKRKSVKMRRIATIAERDVIGETAALHYCFFYRVKIIWKKNIVLQHQHSVIALHHKNKAPAYRAVIVDPIALHHCFFLRLNLLEPGDFW